jgi:hypothetical protein
MKVENETATTATDQTDDDSIIVTDEGIRLTPRPRPSADVTLRIPVDVLASLDQIAPTRSMSRDALLRFYIGQGLRQDLANRYGDRVLQRAKEVLTQRLQSEEEVAAILQEIRAEVSY